MKVLPRLALGIGTLLCGPLVLAQPAPLFSGDNLAEWTLMNARPESFALIDSLLRVSGAEGWLRSPREYADFELSGQVRFGEANADSGIFLRVQSGTDFIRGWPGDAYQVQMREISENTSDNPLPLANVYRHVVSPGTTAYQRERVFDLYTGVGEWQDFTIRASAATLSVELNGELVTELQDLENLSGYIGFQSETGTVEYRALVIDEL